MRGFSRSVRLRVKRRVGLARLGERWGASNLRCLSGNKLCRLQLNRGSLQSALQATFKDGLVSLPDHGAKMADGSALLTASGFGSLEGPPTGIVSFAK